MTNQPETTVTVDALARMLSAADVEINHGDYPTWDTLAESGQKQYRQAARYLLKRLHITTPAAVSAAVAPPTGRAALRCVCGDPIEWRDYEDGSGWIHSPGSDTPCLDARPATDEIRAQLLHAIDHAYTTGVLGYTSPEDLLAAYDNSRTPATSRAAALERVRALHQPMQRGPFTICAHCSGWDGEWRCRGVVTDYPCPTISALPAAKPADRAALRERIAAAIYERNNPGYQWADAHPDDRLAYGFDADAVLAVLPEPTDRTAVLREADWIVEHCPDHGCVEPSTEVCHCEIADRLRRKAEECPECGDSGACNGGPCPLRRMADETATETPQPRRGDAFEQWLKARRDEWAPEGCQPWQILDQTLEEYRLHADTGTPLGEHVCEGKAVGDCECLEQPAAGARQDQTATETPDVYLTTPCDACDHTLNWHSSGETGCTVLRCACARYYHAAGARQDGDQS
jgi:hypothetical protein